MVNLKVKWLDELCEDHGITAEELSERSGVCLNRLNCILARRWTPSPEDRKNIAVVFKRSPEKVIWGHETMVVYIKGEG